MRTCPFCAHSNMEGVFFCEECGEVLVGANQTSTKKLDHITNQLIGKSTWGTARLDHEASVVLHIRDAVDPVMLPLVEETTIGRSDQATATRPVLDLSAFGALEKGVSRL